jgi:hypothetical protein
MCSLARVYSFTPLIRSAPSLHLTHLTSLLPTPPALFSLVRYYRNKSSFFISLHRLIDLWTEEICQEE